MQVKSCFCSSRRMEHNGETEFKYITNIEQIMLI
jgi:hypothetical protein